MLRTIHILLAFALLQKAHSYDIQCGVKWMDNNKGICCGGQIHQKLQNSREMACCERSATTELYVLGEKICCGEQLIQVQPNHNLICCNKELIDKMEYFCCGNEHYGIKYSYGRCCKDDDNKKAGIHYNLDVSKKCCGTDLYDRNSERCIFRNNGQRIIESKTPLRDCGTRRYNSYTSLCCNGTVIDKPKVENGALYQPDWVCWNGKAYDRKKYYWDDKTSQVILIGSGYCGAELYIKALMMCCGNNTFPLIPGKNLTCCGNKVLDLDDKSVMCCNGRFIPTSTQDCCNNVPYDKGHDIQCCARTLYNKTSHICCQSQSSHMTVEQKLSADHTACCRSSETNELKTFNNHTEECVKGKLQKISQGGHTTRHVSVENNPTDSKDPKKPNRCPFCRKNIDEIDCDKSNVYRFFVFDERETKNGTIFNAVILEPFKKGGKILTGEKIKIRTRNQCECFKPRQNFYLFTNRKIKSLKQNRYNIRFTSNDVFIRQSERSLVYCLTQHGLN